MSNEKLHDDRVELQPENPIESQQKQSVEKKPDTLEEAPKIEEVRETIDQTVESVNRPDIELATSNEPVSLPPANNALKAQTLSLTLQKTRQQLSKPQKAFSKVIHQPQVDAISEATSKTIARPMGLFFGGLFALIGSALYLFLSYRYHFAYKYIAFSLFFIGGFIIGLFVELLTKLFKRSKA